MPCRNTAAALPLLLVMVACGGPAPVAPPPEQATTEPATSRAPSVPLRGIVATSQGVTTFCECGAPSGQAVSLADPTGELAKAYASVGANPANGIYIELDGSPAVDGKTLALTTLRRARALGEGIACDTPVFEGEFVASGNEPFWAVEIREDGITFRSPEEPNGRTYPYAFTRTETGSVVYATKIEKPAVSTLEVSLEPVRCSDSMSGELRSFKAHVVLDGKKLEGCARAGVPNGEFGSAPLDELNRFTGTYPRTVHLWREPALSKRLDALLGTSMREFLENMKVQSPLMKDHGVFYVTGNKPHQGGVDNAFFLADPASDTLVVILFVKGSRHDFKEGGRDVALPAEIATMIGNVEKP